MWRNYPHWTCTRRLRLFYLLLHRRRHRDLVLMHMIFTLIITIRVKCPVTISSEMLHRLLFLILSPLYLARNPLLEEVDRSFAFTFKLRTRSIHACPFLPPPFIACLMEEIDTYFHFSCSSLCSFILRSMLSSSSSSHLHEIVHFARISNSIFFTILFELSYIFMLSAWNKTLLESDCRLCSEMQKVFTVEEDLRKESQAFSSTMEAPKRKRSFQIASIFDWKTIDQNESLTLGPVNFEEVCQQWKKDLIDKRVCQHQPRFNTPERQLRMIDSKQTSSNSILECESEKQHPTISSRSQTERQSSSTGNVLVDQF